MADTYGVLGGTDAASLIQRQPSGEWRAIARGKLDDLRPIAATLNEADLLRALNSGANDVAVRPLVPWPEQPAGLPDHLQPAAAPDFIESNRKALEDEAARPLFPHGTRERVNLAQRKTPERCQRCDIRISVFGYRLHGGFGFYCPECNTAHPDPVELLERPAGQSINYAMLARLRDRPEALEELRGRRWSDGDLIRDGKGGAPYTPQGARFLEERKWK